MSEGPDRSAPLFWLLFAGGGTVSAMLLPVLVFITGIAVPAGWVTGEELTALLGNTVTRLILAGLTFLFLFHWAHRFRYALVDLGFGRLGRQAWLFYGAATVGTLLAVVTALRL
ncbi:MAG: fumarate reductase subunit D [Actinobacteria bacterium]|nr:fumarate reductase subunit D [Actinomycetota bacterium]MCI0545588.1 fumarate reductase subunit D [Actinomycetota bacterium]MCI0677896.1 fumarate reductase subunit D [Actinomycetota bacterium]